MTLVWLLFAHLLGDYPLQGPFLSANKGQNPILLATHAGLWTGCIALALTLLGRHPSVGVVAFLFIGHALLDLLKARRLLWYRRINPETWGLGVDQTLHLGQLLLVLHLT